MAQRPKKHARTVSNIIILKKDTEYMVNELQSTSWKAVTNGESYEQSCEAFKTVISQLLSKYTKTTHGKYKCKQSLPWFSEQIWNLMKEKKNP